MIGSSASPTCRAKDLFVSTVARAGLVAAVFLAACHCSTPGANERAAASRSVAMLESHRGATALWHDPSEDLWVSVVQDWHRPSPIRISRADGPIHLTLVGWVAGVHEGHALVLTPLDEDELAVESIDAEGHATRLATVPALPSPYRYSATVTSGGEVVVAGGVTEEERDVLVVGPDGTRRLPGIVERGDAVWSIAADPSSLRIALVVAQVVGTPTIDRPARLLLVDTRSGEVDRRELSRSLSATEGEVAFDTSGALWLHRDDAFSKLEGEVEQRHLSGMRIDARNMVMAADGGAIAFSQRHGGGHFSAAGPSCTAHFVATSETRRFVDPVRRFDVDCYFGLGLAIVGDTLWIAPP